MRVLHVQKARGIGGSERHLLDLLPRLPDEGFDPRMLVLRAPGYEIFADALDDRRIRRREVDAGPDVNPAVAVRILREIRASGAALVHTHLVHADVHGQLVARLARVPGIASMHGSHPFYRREPIRTAVRVALRSARRVIAISGHVAGFLVANRFASADRIRVVPYGIDEEQWRPYERDREDERKRRGLPDDVFVVGMASRLVPGKGHRLAIEAVRRACAREPRIRLLVAGSGPLADALARAAGPPDGVVRMVGFVNDMRPFMASCDAILVPSEPSFGEGFGLAALEAMAAGRPVVVTRVDSLPEVVGDAGIVVRPEDPTELADALIGLVRDPAAARERAAAGSARARDRYSLDAMVRATADVYREVA